MGGLVIRSLGMVDIIDFIGDELECSKGELGLWLNALGSWQSSIKIRTVKSCHCVDYVGV